MRRLAPLRSGAALALSVTLGASAQEPLHAPDRRPLGQDLPSFEAPGDPAATPADAPPVPVGTLRLRDALAASLIGNPALAARSYEMRAREAAALQAGRLPNPVVSTEVEDVFGTGDFGGTHESQTTIQIGQLVELGGKRAARRRLAAAEQQLAGWDYETERISVLTQTSDAFVEVLAAQERLRLAGEALEVARAVHRVAGRRVAAGLASPAEEIRAGVAVDAATVEREHADHELDTARTDLVALWGGTAARFDRAEGDLSILPDPPPLEELQRRVAESPAVARWAAELEGRDAAVAGARSRRVPDVMVAAGPRYIAGPGDTAFVFGLSVPLPLWNRNEGSVADARHRMAKAASEQRAAVVRITAEVTKALTALRASSEEAELLETRVLPGIGRALAALQRGYERGRNSQLEVFESARAQLAAREQYLRALVEAHHNALQIERLTGASLREEP